MSFLKRIIDNLLAFLAKKIVKKYKPQIIGITGSMGKTSAKEAVFSVFEGCGNVRSNIKNYNTEIGLPLTIINAYAGGKNPLAWLLIFIKAYGLLFFKDKNYPTVLILEMGADHPGDIQHLVTIAPCDIAVVTTVGETHLEFFGDINKVKAEKEILVTHLNSKAVAILNRDDKLVWDMRQSTRAKVLTFGFDMEADFRAGDLIYRQDETGQFSHLSFKIFYQSQIISVNTKHCIAKSHIYAFLAGVAAGVACGFDFGEVVAKLEAFKPPKGRMNLIDGIKRTQIIDDTYNSSPQAAMAALEVLKQLPNQGRKIAVLGDMLELGVESENLHELVGIKAGEIKLDLLITYGERARAIGRGAKKASLTADNVFSFTDQKQTGRFIQDRIVAGDLILIKGSQGMRMEKIVKEIMAEPLLAGQLLVRQEDEWIQI